MLADSRRATGQGIVKAQAQARPVRLSRAEQLKLEMTKVNRIDPHQFLKFLERKLEVPMIILGLVWLVLLIIEFTLGLNPILETVGTLIWGIFIFEFFLKLFLSQQRTVYLKRNWLSAIALLLPALRILRIGRSFRILRTLRGIKLVRLISSFNRGMKALRRSMKRRGFGYVLILTVLVTIGGAAGMYAFEKDLPHGQGLSGFWAALWWTAMIMATLGSEYWPKTVEGRVLCLLLALYAFSVFGYVTATFASFFIDRDAADPETDTVGSEDIEALRQELAVLRISMMSMEQSLKQIAVKLSDDDRKE